MHYLLFILASASETRTLVCYLNVSLFDTRTAQAKLTSIFFSLFIRRYTRIASLFGTI